MVGTSWGIQRFVPPACGRLFGIRLTKFNNMSGTRAETAPAFYTLHKPIFSNYLKLDLDSARVEHGDIEIQRDTDTFNPQVPKEILFIIV